jgi:hypothetical protein
MVLHIAGRLEAAGVSELDTLARDTTGPVLLDVMNLDGADEEGLTALRRLQAEGASLRGIQPYLALRLREGREDSK